MKYILNTCKHTLKQRNNEIHLYIHRNKRRKKNAFTHTLTHKATTHTQINDIRRMHQTHKQTTKQKCTHIQTNNEVYIKHMQTQRNNETHIHTHTNKRQNKNAHTHTHTNKQ